MIDKLPTILSKFPTVLSLCGLPAVGRPPVLEIAELQCVQLPRPAALDDGRKR